jgi:hypothetical protein
MSLRRIADVQIDIGKISATMSGKIDLRLAGGDDGVGYALTQGAGEDPYGTPYHAVVRADQLRDMAPELLQLLGATMEELLDLKAKLAVRSERAES